MIFDNFSGRRPAVPLAFCQQKPLTKICRKKIIFLQMVFFTKWLMTKVDRSKNTYFLFCKIFIKPKCHSKKFNFIIIPAGLKEKTTIELFSRNGSDYSNFEFRYEKSFKNCIDSPGAGLLHSTPSCSYRRCFIRNFFWNFRVDPKPSTRIFFHVSS